MQLLTKAIAHSLPPLYATENDNDPIVRVKFFDPCGSWTWYATEFDPGPGRFFGLIDGQTREFGYFTLAELQRYRGPLGIGIERDRYFTPCHVSQLEEHHHVIIDIEDEEAVRHYRAGYSAAAGQPD